MQREAIQKFLDGYYADRSTNEAAALLKYVTPSMSYAIAGSDAESPVIATGPGAPSIEDIARAMVAAWKWRRVEIKSRLIEGAEAAVYFRLRVEYAPKGETVEMDVANFWTFSEGRCKSLVEFGDAGLMRRLLA